MATLGLRRQSYFSHNAFYARVSINMASMAFNSATSSNIALPSTSPYYVVNINASIFSMGLPSGFTITPTFTVFSGSTCVFSWSVIVGQSTSRKHIGSPHINGLVFNGGDVLTVVYRQYHVPYAGDVASLSITALSVENG